MEKDKILVTGSNGQLGQCIKDIVNSFYVINKKYIFTTREEFDITNYEMMKDYLSQHNDIKAIINCAAYTDVKGSETEEGYEKAKLVNIEAVKILGLLCKEYDIFLIHIGTDYIYPTADKPIKETKYNWLLSDGWFYTYYGNDINEYGYSKLKGIKELFNIKDLKFVVIITSWLYSEYGKNFVKTIWERCLKNEESEVVLTEIGSPTYAKDLAEYIVYTIDKDMKFYPEQWENYKDYGLPIINFANLGTASWYDIAKEIEYFATYHDVIKPRLKPFDKVKRPTYSVLDTSKLLHFNNDNKFCTRYWRHALDSCLQRLNEIRIKEKRNENLQRLNEIRIKEKRNKKETES